MRTVDRSQDQQLYPVHLIPEFQAAANMHQCRWISDSDIAYHSRRCAFYLALQ